MAQNCYQNLLKIVPKSIWKASWGRLPIQGRSLIESGTQNGPKLIQKSTEIGPKIDPEGGWEATSNPNSFFLRFWLRFWSISDAKIKSKWIQNEDLYSTSFFYGFFIPKCIMHQARELAKSIKTLLFFATFLYILHVSTYVKIVFLVSTIFNEN